MSEEPTTPTISSAAQAAWRHLLGQPMHPAHLVAYAKCLNEVMGDAFITGAGSTWARECHLGGRFAEAIGATLVSLGDQPDLTIIDCDGVERRYELTEALEPGRRRNQEYREDRENLTVGKSAARSYVPDNVGSTLEALRMASKAKTAKIYNYGPDPVGLVIYLNTDLHTFEECVKDLECSLHDCTVAAGACFAEVWVLWANRLYLVWQAGRQVVLEAKAT